MASTPKKSGEPTPITDKIKEVEQERPEVREAKKQVKRLIELRANALTNLQAAINHAKSAEQQSFVFRGRISVYEEEITALQKKHGLEEIPS